MKGVHQKWITYKDMIQQPLSVLRSIREVGSYKNSTIVFSMAGSAVMYLECLNKLKLEAKYPGQMSPERRAILSGNVRDFGRQLKRYLSFYEGSGCTVYSKEEMV